MTTTLRKSFAIVALVAALTAGTAGCSAATPPAPVVTVTVQPEPTVEPAPEPTVEPAPPAETAPGADSVSGDAVFTEGFVKFFGITPTPEVRASAQDIAYSADEAYAAGASIEQIYTAFIEGWLSGGATEEDGQKFFVLSLASYGSPELYAALEAAVG